MPLKALLLSKDPDLLQCLSKVLANLDFAVEHCSEPFAAAKCLMDQRFDVILVDCDDNQGAAWVIQSARMAALNKAAVTVAISGQNSSTRAAKLGENLRLNKPVNAAQAESTLRSAKDLILKNRETTNPVDAPSFKAPAAELASPSDRPGSGAGYKSEHHQEVMPPATSLPSSFSHEHAPRPALDLPSAPELLARIDEAFPSVSSTSSQGSAAAAAPAREVVRGPAASQPKTSLQRPAAQESTSLRPPKMEEAKPGRDAESVSPEVSNRSKVETPSSRIASAKMPTKPEASVAPGLLGLRGQVDAERSVAPAAKAKTADRTQAASPAVQPIPADFAASVPERGSWLESDSADTPPASGKVIKFAVLAAALVAVIAAVAFSKLHSRHASVAPVAPSVSIQPETPHASEPAPVSAGGNDSAGAGDVSEKPAPKPSRPTNQPAGNLGKEAKSADEPVISGEKIAVRVPSTVASSGTPEEQPVEPPTGVTTPGVAPNLGNVVAALPAAMPATAPPSRVSISQGVSRGLLIHQVNPIYPSLARATHITGAVQLRAVIGKDGSVRSLTVIGGHPLLTKAAMDAVRQWRYKPYLLNGQPLEVETQITIQFRM
jgi:protein TonB